MSVASTIIEAYHRLKADGTLTTRQQQVMNVIKEGRDYSLQELVHLTGLQVNVISARVNELKTGPDRKLEEGPKRRCTQTNRKVIPVRLAPKQRDLF